ncbi:hypothetical protein [Streptomyces achromogenes]|uniref:hypothetical protein n=1 Tax=Streptomyces achromogenes TaxID=67255 RepID=UPI00369D674F
MSTTGKPPNRNQDPEPVRTRFARLFRRRPSRAVLVPGTSPYAKAGRMAPEGFAAGLRRAEAPRTAQYDAAHWKRPADTYAPERDAAYRERAQLLAWLAALHPGTAVRTPATDTNDEDGWQLLYLVAGGWQMSWHIHPADTDLFRHVTVVSPSDPRAQWDGHTAVQKYERLRGHVQLLALGGSAGDGSSSGVTAEERAAVLEDAADHLVRQAAELWAPGTKAHTVMLADAAELRILARRQPTQGTAAARGLQDHGARR